MLDLSLGTGCEHGARKIDLYSIRSKQIRTHPSREHLDISFLHVNGSYIESRIHAYLG